MIYRTCAISPPCPYLSWISVRASFLGRLLLLSISLPSWRGNHNQGYRSYRITIGAARTPPRYSRRKSIQFRGVAAYDFALILLRHPLEHALEHFLGTREG